MSDKPIAHYLRLKDNHPTMKKLLDLYHYAETIGIGITFDHNGAIVHDDEWDGPMLVMRYIEEDTNDGVTEWPPSTDFKVTYENPVWVAEEERKMQEHLRQLEEAARQRSEAAKKAAETRAENARREKEERDRKELARLKELYPDG